MAPPRIPDSVIKTIEIMWAENPSQTATEVFAKFRRRHNDKISLRTVQGIVRQMRKTSGHRSYPRVEWMPWRNEIESREDGAYLLTLDAIKIAYSGRHLYQHEANWGRRIRSALDGLKPWEQSVFVYEYARREEHQYVFKLDQVYTADLDGLLAYQPWKAGHQHAYEAAVSAGVVERPLEWEFAESLDSFYAIGEFGKGHTDFPPYKTTGFSNWFLAQLMFLREPVIPARIHDMKPSLESLESLLGPVAEFWGALVIPGRSEEHSVAPEGANHEG